MKISKNVIETRNLGKKYKIPSTAPVIVQKNSLARWTSALKLRKTQEHWAIKNINIKIERGSVVAIIGKNGSGKSTLLRLLSEITDPTEGEIILRGSVSSMLEAGVGFHPELTGRENIYLNGTLMAISRKEIDEQFENIVAFSELTHYLDTPMKKYSSGMFARLAFAVATHLARDVLIVDEVLSISDSSFREKSIALLKQLAANGVTILVVSHDVELLKRLCHDAILLRSGSLIDTGKFDLIYSQYFDSEMSGIHVETPEEG